MKSKKEIQDELKSIAPFLSELKREEGFKVPKDFFSKLPKELITKIKKEQLVEEKYAPGSSPNWLDHLIHYFSSLFQVRLITAFATVAILMTAGWFLMNKQTASDETQYLSELSVEEMQIYLNENIDELDDELLIELSTNEEDFFITNPTELNDKDIETLIDELDDETLEELL